MRWKGKTKAQREERKMRSKKKFAILPVQINTGVGKGTWVWLEYYVRQKRLLTRPQGGTYTETRLL